MRGICVSVITCMDELRSVLISSIFMREVITNYYIARGCWGTSPITTSMYKFMACI